MNNYQRKAEDCMTSVLALFLTNDSRFGRQLGDAKGELHKDDFETLQELIKIMPNYDDINPALLVASFALELLELRKSLPLLEGINLYKRPERLGETLMQNQEI